MAAPSSGGGGSPSQIIQGLLNLIGASSWFGGPNDPTAASSTASGAPISTPGIAVNNQQTLGGFWLIKAPNGSVGIVKQTDIGPATWTGRLFDYTYTLLGLFGYTQNNFPTGGQTHGIYLGKDLTTISTHLGVALKQIGANPEQAAVLTQSVDAGAIEQGKTAVVAPLGQKPGTTRTGSGQTTSSSEAQSAGLNISIPGLGALEQIAALLTSTEFWLRLGEALAGIILLAMGLRSLTGNTTTPASVARTVRAHV